MECSSRLTVVSNTSPSRRSTAASRSSLDFTASHTSLTRLSWTISNTELWFDLIPIFSLHRDCRKCLDSRHNSRKSYSRHSTDTLSFHLRYLYHRKPLRCLSNYQSSRSGVWCNPYSLIDNRLRNYLFRTHIVRSYYSSYHLDKVLMRRIVVFGIGAWSFLSSLAETRSQRSQD